MKNTIKKTTAKTAKKRELSPAAKLKKNYNKLPASSLNFEKVTFTKEDLTERGALTQTNIISLQRHKTDSDIRSKKSGAHQIKVTNRGNGSSSIMPSFAELVKTGNFYSAENDCFDIKLNQPSAPKYGKASQAFGYAIVEFFLKPENKDKAFSAYTLLANAEFRAIVNSVASNMENNPKWYSDTVRDCMRDLENFNFLKISEQNKRADDKQASAYGSYKRKYDSFFEVNTDALALILEYRQKELQIAA